MNHKKIYRLYREADQAVRRRRKAKRPASERLALSPASQPNVVCSMGFVSDALANGRRLKYLAVAGAFTHEGVRLHPRKRRCGGPRHSGAYVIRVLDRAACFRGYPRAVRTDNGPEFTNCAFIAWTQGHDIEYLLIEPGRPTHNDYIESFNG